MIDKGKFVCFLFILIIIIRVFDLSLRYQNVIKTFS